MKILGREATLTEWRISLMMAFLLLAGAVHAMPEIYVAMTGDSSTGDSWATAYTNVQTAIDNIDDEGVIYLKGDVFTVTNQLEMIGGSDITIRGGYEGVGSPGAQDQDLWPTTIRLAEGYESRVFYIEGATNGVLEDIRVADGNKVGIELGDAGGGLCLSNNVSMTLRGCIITNNLAEKYGGGLAIIGTSDGYSGPTTLDACVLVGNRVVFSGYDSYGGGLYATYARTITMTDCLILTNNAHGTGPYGGGMSLYRTTVDASRTLFADNWLSGSSVFRGGAAHVGSVARLNLLNCTVRDNRCVGGTRVFGAGIYTDSSSSFYIRNTLFHGNIVSGSTLSNGGAISHSTGNALTLDNCTFFGNLPNAVNRENVNGPIELNNCILWGNNGQDIIDQGTTLKTTAFHCNIEDGFNNGTNNCISLDPLFRRPGEDFSLLDFSPCRERGKPLDWHTADMLDLAGNPRVMPRTGIVDIGAFEGFPMRATLIEVR